MPEMHEVSSSIAATSDWDDYTVKYAVVETRPPHIAMNNSEITLYSESTDLGTGQCLSVCFAVLGIDLRTPLKEALATLVQLFFAPFARQVVLL
jgi:hypothetical protein